MHHGYTVFLSNVDGRFQRASFDARDVLEYHGSMHRLLCLDGCDRDVWPAEDCNPVTDDEACELLSGLPTCPKCGGLARSNVRMFVDAH